MQKISQKQLDKMLSKSLLEEAQLAEVPPSEKLWADLQRRLKEEANIQDLEEKLVLLQGAPPKKKNIFQRAYNIVWKRHKYLTGIAAACLVIIISLQVAPSSDTSNFLQRFFSYMSTDMSTTLEGFGDEAQIRDRDIKTDTKYAVPAEENGEQKELPMKAGEKERGTGGIGASPSPAEGAVPRGSAEAESFSLFIDETPDLNHSVQTEISEQGQERAQWQSEEDGQSFVKERTMDEETLQESVLYDRKLFISELNNCKHLAPEKIWLLNSVPNGFTFSEAVITQTDTFLYSVSQKYTNEENKVISLTQEFFPNKVPDNTELTTPDSLAHPIRVGPYNGYVICEKNGFNTIRWKQDNSIITLSGQLAEKILFNLVDNLKKS
ncbi:MAG TPA: DUF4367 domain-containing protein [Firmicutes bacterium]|jgi:hypothetical protein|nr:DUF4367 domain-containing protein [Bacillota bacterium]